MQYKNISLFILILFSLSLTSCASANNKSTDTRGTLSVNVITHDGYDREYISYVPTNINKNNKVPLLLVLHGGGGTNQQIIKHTKYRFNQLADKDKFYVVYPQGLEKGWNDGRNDLKQFASQNNIDDVGFIQALFDNFKNNYDIDEKRVFVTGISNGGFMSFRLGCELRDKIRAIAPITATIAEDALRYCRGKSEVGLALFNGTDDPLVPYGGGYVKVLGQKRGKITSTEYTVNHWLNMLSCRPLPNKHDLPDIKNDGTTVTKFNYQQCDSGGEVALFRINGGGHTWPGSKEHKRSFKRIVGSTSQDIIACNEIWEFFSSLK